MLDKNMPIMDGVDAANMIYEWKKNGRVQKSVKLVLVTGDETIMVKEYDRKVFDYVIMKPVDKNLIEKILKESNLPK